MAVCEETFWFCDQCGKSFHDRLSQTLHRRTHSIYRPYRCTHKLCTQAFSQLSQLQRHKRVHNNHRKYRCRICKTKFLYLHHLKLHRCRIKDTKIYSCYVCSSKFLQILSLAHHMKTKHSNQKWKRKVKKIKLKSDRKSKGKDKVTPESGKEKILLKIALGKSMTVISPRQTPSHINKSRRAKKKSNKKDKIHRKRLQKNGIILSFRNGSVSSVPLSIENMKEETPVRKLKPFKINGLLNKVVDEPKIPKLRIKTCAYTAVRRDESTEDEDVPELYSMKENSILTFSKKEETKMETCDGLTKISYVPENPSSPKVSTKPRSGIIIHKDKLGKYSSAGQLQTSKSNKCETIDSARCAGLWEVMPSPRTDSPSDFLKLRFSPMKPLKLDSGLDNTFECANAKYLDVSFKTKAVDSCAEDSDVFETSPSAADKDSVGANSVNDSGIEVLSSSSCNRSNGNSVRSVIMDENSPTYFLAEDSLISLDSPLVEAVSKAEHSICMKCGGIIIETNNNTRSPSKCQCSFISPYFTSPTKSLPMVSDDGYTEMEADISVKEQPLHVQDETSTSDIHVPAFVKNYNKINTDFSPNSICSFTPVEVTKVETNERSPLKMKFRLEREPCANIQKQETVVCAVTETKTTDETIQKRKPLFRSDSKTGTIKDLDNGKKKTESPAETSISSAIERVVSAKKPLFKPLKKQEPEDIKVNDTEIKVECESNDDASESHIQTSEAVIIVNDSSDDSQSLNTNCNILSERVHGSNERTRSKNKVAKHLEKVSSFEMKQKIEKYPKKKRASKSPIVNTNDETTGSLSPNDKDMYDQEEHCMHENKPSTVDEIEGECESNDEASELHIQTSEAVIIFDESSDDSQSLKTNCNRISESRLLGTKERTRDENKVAGKFEKDSSFEIKHKLEKNLKKGKASKSPIINANDETSLSSNDKDICHQEESCMHENKPSTVDEIEEECEINDEASELHIHTSEAVIIFDESSDDSQSLKSNCNRMSESRLLGTKERTRNENKVAGKFEKDSSFEIKHKLEKSLKKRKASKSPIINTNNETSLSPNDKDICHQEESCMHENKPSTVDEIVVNAKAADADGTIDLSPGKPTSDINLSVPPVNEIVSFNIHASSDISSQSQLDFATKSPVHSPSKSTMPSPVISQLDHISVSPSKSPSVSPLKASKAALKLSAEIPGKNRENIFSTMASDFHHSSSVSPEKYSTSGFHNINKTDTPLKSGNDGELCKSPNEKMLVCFGQEVDDLNCKEVDNYQFAMKKHPAKIENEVNVLEEAKSHCSATPSIDKNSQPANSGLSSVVKHTSIIENLCAADFNEDSLQSLQKLPKETDLSIISGVSGESEDSLQQLPNVIDNLPTTSSKTPEKGEKKDVTSPLDLFQQQFLSFLSNKGPGLDKNIKAVTDTTEKEITTKNKNKKVKPCGKRKTVLKKSNHSTCNKIKPSDKSKKSDVDMNVTSSEDIGESCGVGIVNDPMFDTEMDLEHSPDDQNNDKSSTALDWLKCTFDSNTNEDSGNISKGSQSPELDLTIIVKDNDMKGKNLTDRERTKSGGSKLKLKKQSTRSKFDELEVKSNFPTAKKKRKVSRVDDTHKKQILEYESDNSLNSFTSDSNSNHNYEKINLINSQKAKCDRRPVGVKHARSETKMIETDSDNSHSLSNVQTFKSLSTQNIDGASVSSSCANVNGYNNTGTNQDFGDSDPDYNPFGEPDDDFYFRHRIGSHRPKRNSRCITDDSSDDFTEEEINLRSENRTCEKMVESDDSRNRGRRTMQGRKSCCPCCLGLSRPNKQDHDGYAHTKHMYNLPRNYKQFIKSTTKLLALQESVHKLFISLFPDCSNLISKSQVGTEDFELLIDEVISGLDTNTIEFESVNSGILLNSISTEEPFYTETASTCPILPPVPLGTDCNTEDPLQPTNEDMQTEVTETMQYLVDAVIMKSDPVECHHGHCISNFEGTPCINCCQQMETFNQSMSEPNVPEIHEDGTIVKRKHAYNTEVITDSLNYDTNNECSNREVLLVDKQPDNCNYGDPVMPTLLNICNNETMKECIQVDQSNAFLPLFNAPIGGENSTFDNEAVPLQFGMESERLSSMSSAISPVKNKLVITIDLNAARVSLCKHPTDCLQRLHAKIVKLVMALLPNLKLKRSILKNQDNLEFLLDLIAKSNDGPITSDNEEVEPFDEKSPSVAAFVANCSAIVTADSEPICVEVIRTDRKMNDETSNNGERQDKNEKCGNVITNFLAKCEKLEAEKHVGSNNNDNEKANSETLNMLKEERIPLFSKCQEMFENDIKSRKESLKKDIFDSEEDPDAVMTDHKGSEHVLGSFRKISPRKKRVDIAKKYRKIAKREDKRRKANRRPATSAGSQLHVGNESLQPDSDNTDNTKKRFLSELSLGDRNMNSTTAGGGDQVDNTGHSTCASRPQSTVKSSETSELPSPDSKRHADKNIFELMRPHMEPSSSL